MMPFSDEELCGAIDNLLPKIAEYVKSHSGTMKFLGVKNAIAYVELGGTCSGCSMSTATTKMVIEKRLRELIHPDLVVESIFPGEESKLPVDMVTL